jgi:hypothetical protein
MMADLYPGGGQIGGADIDQNDFPIAALRITT